MRIFAIDPGDTQSAFVRYATDLPRVVAVLERGFEENAVVLDLLKKMLVTSDIIAIEQIRPLGMVVGATVFDTCEWVGRFAQEALHCTVDEVVKMPRKDVKLELLGRPNGTDTQINHALWDYFGGSRKVAVGTKSNPGPMYGITGKHLPAALAVAVTVAERIKRGAPLDYWR